MSGFSVVRDANGQIKMSLYNVKDYDVEGLGTITGDGTVSMGRTNKDSDETVLQVGNTTDTDPLLVVVDDEPDNLEFYGSDIDAKFNTKTDKNYNVSWGVKDGTIDSTKSNASMTLSSTAVSGGSTFKLGEATSEIGGKFDNIIVDAGQNNTFIMDDDSSTYFITDETSNGATMFAGNGANTVNIAGDNSLFVGGSSVDNITTSGTAEGNILMGMAGADNITDFGDSNLLIGGQGKDTLTLQGDGSLANLGNDESYKLKIGESASDNAVFAGENIISEHGDFGGMNTFNYTEYLNTYLREQGISMNDFITRVGLDPKATPYEIVNALRGMV